MEGAVRQETSPVRQFDWKVRKNSIFADFELEFCNYEQILVVFDEN